MPSRLTLNPQISGGSSGSTSNLAQKARAKGLNDVADALDNLERRLTRLERVLATAPSLKSLNVASADIEDLTVGGEKGPGQLTILSGPPDYAPVGWDGTGEEADSVDVLTFNADTVTTDGPHGAEPGHVVHIQGTDQHQRNGYFKVLTTPTTDTYTVADPGGTNATGGTSTVQFGGGWRLQFAFGESEAGGGVETAPVFTSPSGVVNIGKNGYVRLLDRLGNVKGHIGVVPGVQYDVLTAVDNGSGAIRVTVDPAVSASLYADGDDVFITLPGVLAEAGDYMITVVAADTFDLVGSTFSGTYTGGGKIERYRGPFWGRTVRIGGTGYLNAPIVTYRDGSMRIGLANGARLEISASGELSIIDGSLTLTKDGVVTKIANVADGTNIVGLQVANEATPDKRVNVTSVVIEGYQGDGQLAYRLFNSDSGGFLELKDALGNFGLTLNGDTVSGGIFVNGSANQRIECLGAISGAEFQVGGTKVVGSRGAAVADVTASAGAAYGPTEQAMLNALKLQLNALLSRLRAGTGHGLIAP